MLGLFYRKQKSNSKIPFTNVYISEHELGITRYNTNLARRIVIEKSRNGVKLCRKKRVSQSCLIGERLKKGAMNFVVISHHLLWDWGWYDVIKCYNDEYKLTIELVIRNRTSLSAKVEDAVKKSLKGLQLENSNAFIKFYTQNEQQ